MLTVAVRVVWQVCAKDILNYQQGAFALIEDDLARAPPGVDSAASIRVLRRACQLPQVFALRKALPHGQSAAWAVLQLYSSASQGDLAVGCLGGLGTPRSRQAH